MPLTPPRPLTDRKDRLPLTSTDQRQDGYLPVGWNIGGAGTDIDGVMEFLFRLYAYYLHWYARSRGIEGELPEVFGRAAKNATPLKIRLMCSVPHAIQMTPKVKPLGPSGLVVRSARVAGTTQTQFMVLWPGAWRERYARSGKRVSTFNNRLKMCGLGVAKTTVMSFVTGVKLGRLFIRPVLSLNGLQDPAPTHTSSKGFTYETLVPP